ncbi:probable carboxylesterase 120 [Malania oleifera]|uniref:probable carboxylesterase 120 n=1 Tax=Malania oleifera TaxID=397392 RepID=UPI0025AEAC05|nr:probable carboxylesterase 120 [Malania oleifera]
MADETVPANLTLDLDQAECLILKMVRKPDGTITWDAPFTHTPAAPDPTSDTPVLTTDVTINESNGTWLRIFLPRRSVQSSSSVGAGKLPLVVYFHGGGFIICSAATTEFHNFCATIAAELPAMVVSVEYRLSPKHRLPAAYDDAVEALHWIRFTDDQWLKEHADFSNCFLMGSSAGGNMAYWAGLRVVEEDLSPLRIGGLILHQPFFGGIGRSGSELRLMNDAVLPLWVTDLMWDQALPEGADRDHEFCNVTSGGGCHLLEQIGRLGWRVMVTGCSGDLLIDRQVEFAKVAEGKGVAVAKQFEEGGYHCAEVIEPSKGKVLLAALKNFVLPNSEGFAIV